MDGDMSAGDLHCVVWRAEGMDHQTWLRYVDHMIYREFAGPIAQLMFENSDPLLIGPMRRRSVDIYKLPPRVTSGIELVMPVRAVSLEDSTHMMMPALWIEPPERKIVWTAWKRLKFLFTGKLPKE